MSEKGLTLALKMRTKLSWLIPRPIVHALGIGIGSISYHLLSSRRQVAIENLQSAFDLDQQQAQQLTQQVFRNLGVMITEILFTPTLTPQYLEKHISIEGEEYLEEAQSSGQNGIILYSAHFGNWELLGGILTTMGLSLNAVARQQDNAAADQLLTKIREQYGLTLYPRGMGFRDGYRALKRGELLVLLGDQEARQNGWFVDFFGRQASTFTGPVQLAQRTGATILPVFMARVGIGKHKVIFYPPVKIGPNATQAELHNILQKLTSITEEVIRKYPEQWFWIHRRWKTQPQKDREHVLNVSNSGL